MYSVVLFTKIFEKNNFLVSTIVCGFFLITSHHLTTFYLILLVDCSPYLPSFLFKKAGQQNENWLIADPIFTIKRM